MQKSQGPHRRRTTASYKTETTTELKKKKIHKINIGINSQKLQFTSPLNSLPECSRYYVSGKILPLYRQ